MQRFYFLILILLFTYCQPSNNEPLGNYYNDGSIRLKFIYPEDKDSSIFIKEHYYQNSQLASRGKKVNNQMTGPWTWWYENGTIKAQSTYLNDRPIDTTLCYYDNGQLSRTLYQIDLEKDYWFVTDYHENGRVSVKSFWHSKERIVDSTWTVWDESGQLIEQGEYDNSHKIGTWIKKDF